jgi:hypothetical protein
MNKITAEHLARDAYVYERQSTADQLLNNPESRRRQYDLVARARSLGWENVIVIDEDLGRSGSGQRRPGFERLLAAICVGTAGAVFAIEASRLARNGRDWHTLLEFCAFVNSLIIDEDGIHDPRLINDRLLLGMSVPLGCQTKTGGTTVQVIAGNRCMARCLSVSARQSPALKSIRSAPTSIHRCPNSRGPLNSLPRMPL